MPAPYTRIACFIDRDPASDVTLAEAAALREQSGGELHVVYVATVPWALYSGFYGATVPVLDLREEGKQWLEQRLAGVPGATGHVLDGWPPRAACEFAAATGVDLLVGAAHRGVVRRAMLGGFAAYVAYHAPCPVLLVHPPVPADGEGGTGG